MIGRPLTEFFSGDELDALMDVLKEVVKDGKPITTPPLAVGRWSTAIPKKIGIFTA